MLNREWQKNEYPKYAVAIREAERKHGIPPLLLARQLAKETNNFDADIIAGKGRNKIGAIGIAAMMPYVAFTYGVNRNDPYSSIEGAARYLRDLYRVFHDWPYSLAAFNHGETEVRLWIREGKPLPRETREYLASVIY